MTTHPHSPQALPWTVPLMTETQLPLLLSLDRENTFSNYHAQGNEVAIASLSHAIDGSGERLIYLWNPQAVGRTHLLQAACHEARNQGLSAMYLPLSQIYRFRTDLLKQLECVDFLAIDDLEAIGGHLEWEEAFLELFNCSREKEQRLLLASTVPPIQLGCLLPDLTSRFQAALIFQIHELSEQGKIDALIARALHRGLTLPEPVARFLLNRFPRDMRSLFQLLDQLDRATLSEKRKLTIPFVNKVLLTQQ